MADIRVEDVMTHLVVMLFPGDTISQAAKRLAHNAISGAPVVQDGKVIGIVSEADLIRAAMRRQGQTMRDVMTHRVEQIEPGTSIWKAAAIMEGRGVKRLPVVDESGHLLGIVSRGDVVKAIAREDDLAPGRVETASL